jgi:uncharacterized protein YneF (UPF0154 family)
MSSEYIINNKYIINNSKTMLDEDNITIICYIFTIVIGLILGMIIGYYNFKSYIYKGPDSNIISVETYTDSDGKKYKWVPKVCICPLNYSMIKLKDPEFVDPNH